MKKFTQFIVEKKTQYDLIAPTSEEIEKFLTKVKKNIPINVIKSIYLTQKYHLFEPEKLDLVRLAKKPELKRLVNELNIPLNDLEDLHSMFKEMGQSYKMMPQYISKSDRELILSGKEHISNVVIDVESKQGREAIAKQYMPLITKYANYYAGNSSRSRTDLISAGTEGLMMAIKKYSEAKAENTGKFLSLGSYIKSYVKGYMLNDINDNYSAASGTSSMTGRQGQSISIDNLVVGDDEIESDYNKYLAKSDNHVKIDEEIKKLIDILSKKFSHRDVDIFCRYFGIGTRDRMKSKDIAKMYGLGEAAIKNGPINKIVKYIKQNKELMEIMSSVRDYYNESLLVNCFDMSKTQIYEYLLSDYGFVILEELNKWNNKKTFLTALNKSLSFSDSQIILDLLSGDFITIDNNIKKHRKTIVEFLEHMYPSEKISGLNDVDLIEMMVDLQNYYHKYNH